MRASSKLTSEHLSREAVVYVRQSTQLQVVSNRESQRLQYGLSGLARDYGFAAVTVIDEDLGRSGSGLSDRPGFERLVASVCQGQVGAVFCLEASRLARNGRDWHRLIELCALVATVIVDPEGVYDPQRSNDRLLLGMKGTMSEFELSLLRQRSQEAKEAKAARGELRFRLPVGLCWGPSGLLERDSDRRIRDAVDLVFAKFMELGSARQVFLWLLEQQLSFPTRGVRTETAWERPTYARVVAILKNPLYAGAYAYGRRETRIELEDGRARKTGRREMPCEQWKVLLRDHFEGYISWQQFERNQLLLAENTYMKKRMSRTSARGGRALLTGLLRCARCGRRLSVHYRTKKTARYRCRSNDTNLGEPPCINFGAQGPELAIGREILRAIQPDAIDQAIEAALASVGKASERRQAVELELEEAKYQARLAARRFEAVDPDNRLVAAELEARWNDALERCRSVERRLEESRLEETRAHVPDRASLMSLAADLPAVWEDPATDRRLKQRIVRLLIEDIVVDVDEEQEEIVLVIHWQGGRHSETRVPKKARPSTHTDLGVVEIVRKMASGWSDEQIALTLNRLGLRTGKGNGWNAKRVESVRYYHRLPKCDTTTVGVRLTLQEAAQRLDVSNGVVRRLIAEGVLPAEQPVPAAPWAIVPEDLQRPAVRREATRIRERRPRHAEEGGQLSILSIT